MSRPLGRLQIKDLATASAKDIGEVLNSIDEVLCDCDGVLYSLSTPIPGSAEAINWLKASGKNVRFISNNCTKRLETFKNNLNKMGINANADDIVYPTLAIIAYLKSLDFKKTVYVIGTSVMKQELKEAGFSVAPDEFVHFEESISTLVNHLRDDESIGAVVIDWDLNLNYMALQKSLIYLCRKEVLFITGASDKNLPFSTVCNLIGPGHFQDALKEMSGRVPYCLGKPSIHLNDFIMKKYNILEPRRVLFIGDSIPQDMGFASLASYQKLLVLSGISKKEDLENWNYPDAYAPDYYVENLATLHQAVKNKLK